MAIGCKYGTHRVLQPAGGLPQAALKVDNDFSRIFDSEILVDVSSLNIDSASFSQIKAEAGQDLHKVEAQILEIVATRGKMQNPVTGSGGMLIGQVKRIGSALPDCPLRPGDRIASLVSLSLTPLKIEKILKIHPETDRVDIQGQAVLFESGLYAKLPEDMSENLALAALDVAGAPAQAAKLVQPGQSVLILGAGGKSGLLVAFEAMKRAGRVVGNVFLPEDQTTLQSLGLCHQVVVADATQPIELLKAALSANQGREFDLVINCVNVPNTEMASILPCRQGGTVYFFSMATHFGKAALGAEGVGKDITLLIGNGYTQGHAEFTLNALRECPKLRRWFEEKYA